MPEQQKKLQQAIDKILSLDETDVSICLEAIKSGYLMQEHTEAELQDYIQKARQQCEGYAPKN